jgi:hypothetical protein
LVESLVEHLEFQRHDGAGGEDAVRAVLFPIVGLLATSVDNGKTAGFHGVVDAVGAEGAGDRSVDLVVPLHNSELSTAGAVKDVVEMVEREFGLHAS